MKRGALLSICLLIALMLNGCIITANPSKNSQAIVAGEKLSYSVVVYPATPAVTWTLDTIAVGTGSSYTYAPTVADVGNHTLVASQGVSKHTWHLTVTSGYNWSQYQGGPSHTGYVPVNLDVSQFSVLWQKDFNTGQDSQINSVAAADDRVFITRGGYFTTDQAIFALDAKTGANLWENFFGQVYEVSAPSYNNGTVYLTTGKEISVTPAALRAFDAASGSFLYKSPIDAQWEKYYAPTIYDGYIYTNGGNTGGLYAFNPQGYQIWFDGLQQYDQWTPAVNENHVYAYVGNYLHVINRADGTLSASIVDNNFSFNGWSMRLSPVLGSSNDVIAIEGGRLIKFDLLFSTIAYELPDNYSGQPALKDGVIYCYRNGAFAAVQESTGEVLWTLNPPSQDHTLLTNGTILVCNNLAIVSNGNETYAVSLSDQSVVWTYAGGTVASRDFPDGTAPAWSNNVLYLVINGTKLVAISAPAFN